MKTAVCPGSFDPITKGHLDIIQRACQLFDHVIVLVAYNPHKQYCFSAQERIDMITLCTKHLSTVRVDCFSGLLVSYLKTAGASAIVKGLRAMSDFEHEFQQAMVNKYLDTQAETVFLTTAAENMFLSSSLVKEVAHLQGDISRFVPPEIADYLSLRLSQLHESEPPGLSHHHSSKKTN